MAEWKYGFVLEAIQDLSELNAKLYEMEHIKTGAKLIWLEREEENRTFSIAFETLPCNDTGVFHILEHSVLCGSDRYPVKEPFVELLKNSMNTFLNAMTFPDKTFYPVSSTNEKDFLNLMRVYLDAVFHPLIYSRPEIFRQEGWHYEFDENGNPNYKGVVFNEMKGAFADAGLLMESAMSRALFPDTSYRFVSGGDPEKIPNLTYDEFLDSHRRCYSPSNSYLFLDGKIDIDTVLEILDKEYLSGFERRFDESEKWYLSATLREVCGLFRPVWRGFQARRSRHKIPFGSESGSAFGSGYFIAVTKADRFIAGKGKSQGGSVPLPTKSHRVHKTG